MIIREAKKCLLMGFSIYARGNNKKSFFKVEILILLLFRWNGGHLQLCDIVYNKTFNFLLQGFPVNLTTFPYNLTIFPNNLTTFQII